MAGNGRSPVDQIKALQSEGANPTLAFIDSPVMGDDIHVNLDLFHNETVRLGLRGNRWVPRMPESVLMSNEFFLILTIDPAKIPGFEGDINNAVPPALYLDRRPDEIKLKARDWVYGAYFENIELAMTAAAVRLLGGDRSTQLAKAVLHGEDRISIDVSDRLRQQVRYLNSALAPVRAKWLADRVQRWMDAGGQDVHPTVDVKPAEWKTGSEYVFNTCVGTVPVIARTHDAIKCCYDSASRIEWYKKPSEPFFDIDVPMTVAEVGHVDGGHQYLVGASTVTGEDAQRLIIGRHAEILWDEIRSLLDGAYQLAPCLAVGRDQLIKGVHNRVQRCIAMIRTGLMANGTAREYTIPENERRGLPDVESWLTAAAEQIRDQAKPMPAGGCP